jgi:hypothetical protein
MIQTYIVVFFLLLSVYLQIFWLNEGLKRFQIAFIVPIFTAFWIIISVTAGQLVIPSFLHFIIPVFYCVCVCAPMNICIHIGMIYYDEYLGMSYESLGLFILGVFITIMGVVLLATRDYVREEVTDGPDPLRSIIPSNTNGHTHNHGEKHSDSGHHGHSHDGDHSNSSSNGTVDESRPLLSQYGSTGTTQPTSATTANGV